MNMLPLQVLETKWHHRQIYPSCPVPGRYTATFTPSIRSAHLVNVAGHFRMVQLVQSHVEYEEVSAPIRSTYLDLMLQFFQQ